MSQDAPQQQQPGSSGELTLKQAGVMLIVVAAILGGVQAVSAGQWQWGGIPVSYIAGLFGVGGLALAVIGFVKKS